MANVSVKRRRLLACSPSLLLAACRGDGSTSPSGARSLTVYTFGDSILDCGHYNAHGVHPGQLIVRNDDALFPEFRGKDLQSSRGGARLEHRAVDGATVSGLGTQARGLNPGAESVALLTIGGNDLLIGLAADSGAGMKSFESTLDRFLQALPIRPVLLGTVYDPTVGDDARNFLGIDAGIARANHRRVNEIIASLAGRYGKLVDLHAHFLTGDPSWFTHTIEPSLIGASEVRRAFLAALTELYPELE
jgi:lysophospholipase L1-like esterase